MEFDCTLIVTHFQTEGQPRLTIHDFINRLQQVETIKEKKTCCFISPRKKHVKKLTNNCEGLSLTRLLPSRSSVSYFPITVCWQTSKFFCFKFEKTSKHTEWQAEKAKKFCAKNFLTYYIKIEMVMKNDCSNIQGYEYNHGNKKLKWTITTTLLPRDLVVIFQKECQILMYHLKWHKVTFSF